jgi:hypothetical protein
VTGKLRKCDEATIQGRLRKAEQFMEGADTIREFADDEGDIGDAYVTLCVHAGIAAADVICCIALGEPSTPHQRLETESATASGTNPPRINQASLSSLTCPPRHGSAGELSRCQHDGVG